MTLNAQGGGVLNLQVAGATIINLAGTATFINDTADAQNTSGLTINQLTANNQALAFKQNSVAHGLTSAGGQSMETDTWFAVRQIVANGGGWQSEIVAETGTEIVGLFQFYNRDNLNTTKSTAGRGAIEFDVRQHDGVNALANVVADGNLAVIRTHAAGAVATRFIFDTEGSGHGDVEWVAFAAHNDLAVLRSFESLMLTHQRFGQDML